MWEPAADALCTALTASCDVSGLFRGVQVTSLSFSETFLVRSSEAEGNSSDEAGLPLWLVLLLAAGSQTLPGVSRALPIHSIFLLSPDQW